MIKDNEGVWLLVY